VTAPARQVLATRWMMPRHHNVMTAAGARVVNRLMQESARCRRMPGLSARCDRLAR